MDRVTVVLLAIMLIGVLVLGWFLWRATLWEPRASISIGVYLWTSPIQSYSVCNNTVSFQTELGWHGDFVISIENNGTLLNNATLYLTSDESLIPPTMKTLGPLAPNDSVSYGWVVFPPNQEGNYSITGSFVSDRFSCWFGALIVVAG